MTLFEKHLINTDTAQQLGGRDKTRGRLWEAGSPSGAVRAVTRPLDLVSRGVDSLTLLSQL